MNILQKKVHFLLLITLSSVGIFGCQSDQRSQDQRVIKKLNGQFYLRYLETEKELKAEIAFNQPDTVEGTTPVTVDHITLNAMPLDLRRISQPVSILRYDYTNRESFQPNYQLAFSKQDFGSLKLTLSMQPLKGLSIEGDIIQSSKGFQLNWDGPPLSAKQQLIILLNDAQQKTLSLEAKGPTERASFSWPASSLKDLNPGQYQLSAIKKQLERQTQEGLQYIVAFDFYADPIEVEVAP